MNKRAAARRAWAVAASGAAVLLVLICHQLLQVAGVIR